MNNLKQYIPITAIDKTAARDPNGCPESVNAIELELYYSLGGHNYFSEKTERRGYYLRATPVRRKDVDTGIAMVGFQVGSGIKAFLLETARKSNKQQVMACTIAEERAAELLDWCRQEYGVICDTPDIIFGH